MKSEYSGDPQFRKNGGSFIQAGRSKKNVEKSFKKQKSEHESKSKIIGKPNYKLYIPKAL
jgi:hypothetical protein